MILGLSMTREMDFNTHWQQAFAAARAAAGKDRPSVFGFHAGTKSELLFPRAFRWLIGPFHKIGRLKKRRNSSP